MLDVHAPHETVHTWKDFLIHIATIVVGLFIAVGLEQTVERIHRHYELRETREALDRERESNRHHMEVNSRNWLETDAVLRNNLLVLDAIRQHPGLPEIELPGELNFTQRPFEYDHAVWDAAQQNGIVRLMPLKEANADQAFYRLAGLMEEQSLHEWDAVNDQTRFLLMDSDPTHLTPDQLAETTRLTQIALEKHIQMGYSYGRIAREFPDMPQILTYPVLAGLLPATPDRAAMAAAHQRTRQRIELHVNSVAGPAGPSPAPNR
jgi:hypothetical protein